ncbi:MAG: isochorismatase family cysteine hydrolase [Candidatus Binatia bacterium]
MDSLVFDRRRSCSLIIDMTNDALKPNGVYTKDLGERFPDQEELISSNKRLIEASRAANVPVIFTHTARKAGEPRYLKHFVPPIGHRARTYKAESLIEGTWGDEIIDELKPLPNEQVISKKRRSAFLNTPLDLILRSMDVTTLVVTGIGTPGCVESTVRAAFDLDYYIVMPRECTSTTDGREQKDRALLHIGATCAVVSTLEKVMSAMGSPAPIPLLSLRLATA